MTVAAGHRRRAALVTVAVAALAAPAGCRASADDADEVAQAQAQAASSGRPRWRFELKRQETDNGTPGESSKTTLRLEHLPVQQVLTLVRLDLPFPDEDMRFFSYPLRPQLGDVKTRLGFRAFEVATWPVSSFVEFSLPTAHPASLGSGAPQLTLGLRTGRPLARLDGAWARHGLSWSAQVQQVRSLPAGDATQVRYTKFELAMLDTIDHDLSAKLTFKPVIDWTRDGRSGSVLELEGGWPLGTTWRMLLMIGRRAGGDDVPSTYDTRAELTLRHDF